MATLDGESLEMLTALVGDYSAGFVQENAGKRQKEAARDEILKLLHGTGVNEIDIAGNHVKVLAWSREAATRTVAASSGIRLDVRPIRS